MFLNAYVASGGSENLVSRVCRLNCSKLKAVGSVAGGFTGCSDGWGRTLGPPLTGVAGKVGLNGQATNEKSCLASRSPRVPVAPAPPPGIAKPV